MDEKPQTPEFGSAEWVENLGRTLAEIGRQFAEQGAVAMAALGKALAPMTRPAEVFTLTPEEYQQAVANALDSIGCTYTELEEMAHAGVYPTPQHRKVWLAIKPAPAQPETPKE